MSKKTVLAISGSTRAGSSNESILRYLSTEYASQLQFIFYEGLASLPHFNPDLDKDPLPPSVIHLRDSITNADSILICSPEYIFAIPGALKNMIEWMVSTTLVENKPLAFIVASGLGERTFESMTKIVETLSARVGVNSTLLIQGARSKVTAHGKMKDSEVSAALDKLMESFINSMENSG